jgi:diguanylate cyclase (GGDEF)-like protein
MKTMVECECKTEMNDEAGQAVSPREVKDKSVQDATSHRAVQRLLHLIEGRKLVSYFQPIVSLEQREIFAYEALCRTVGPNPFGNIEQLFLEASRNGQTFLLDMYCRQTAIERAARQNIRGNNALLFLNICPNSLIHPDHNIGTTEAFAVQNGLAKEKIVLEITEHEAVHNYDVFRKSIDHYRARGFQIAIDDFGAGYGGLKMLSMLEPDYVKIDGHFFKDHHKSNINYNLVDSIATACHRIGIEVIAEGIETKDDVRICRELGIELLQGFHFAKPAPELVRSASLHYGPETTGRTSGTKLFDEVICIGDISRYEMPVLATDSVRNVLHRFQNSAQLQSLPVLRKGRLCGLIDRRRFMENTVVGPYGFGLNINHYKTVEDILDGDDCLQVAYHESAEEVAKKIQNRPHHYIYDDVCITQSGKYIGVISVSEILKAVTENSMNLAKGANPLTGLPGNEFIQREVVRMLSRSMHFDVCYIDIDNFKPFNDRHGFEKGDRVLKQLAEIIVRARKRWGSRDTSFVGHIGGDDFIMILRPKHSVVACQFIVSQFESICRKFHSKEELEAEHYVSIDRNRKKRKFNLLSLSIGIVSTEIHHISSLAEISSIATDLKKRAKECSESMVIRDRRA